MQTKNYQQAVGIANQLRKRYKNEFARLLGKAIKIAEPILPKENSINPQILFKKINELDKLLMNENKEKVLSIVAELVPDWKRYKRQ